MKTLVISLFASAALGAWAQAVPADSLWTLDGCIDYALAHNLTVKSRELDARSGELAVTEARDGWLPTAQANAQQQFSFGRSLNSLNTYQDLNASNFSWGASLDVPLLQGLRTYRQVKAAKAQLRALLEQTEATRDDIALNVMAAYLQALADKELLGIARTQEALSAVELERRRTLLDAGKIAEAEVLEAESQLAQDHLSVVDADNNVVLALLDLVQLLELDPGQDFDIAPLPEAAPWRWQSADDVWSCATGVNHSLQAARLAVDAARENVSVARAGYLPTLSFNLGIGSSYYHMKGVAQETFGQQMRHNYSTGVGFSLNVPIFDAFSTRNAVRRAKVQQVQSEIQLAQTGDNVRKAIRQAWQQAVGARERGNACQAAVTATASAFEAMQAKYEAGRANATELEQAKTAYAQALAQQVQARYELALRQRILDFYAQGRL